MKNIKRLLSVILTIAICFQLSSLCFAYPDSTDSKSKGEVNIIEFDIIDLAKNLKNDPLASDVKLSGN